MLPNHEFWLNKKVLVTGHTGFKGGWLASMLTELGAKVFGVSLPPSETQWNLPFSEVICERRAFYGNLVDPGFASAVIEEVKPEIVFHLAGQSLVSVGYQDPAITFSTNVQGLNNTISAVYKAGLSELVLVVATTDKVYKNTNAGVAFKETDLLGGSDPYALSKVCAEHVVTAFRESVFRESGNKIVSVRAGNVIGGGDYCHDRIVPDAIQSWIANIPLILRNPSSYRPWQHVLDAVTGYLLTAEAVKSGICLKSINIGPTSSECTQTVKAITNKLRAYMQAESDLKCLIEFGAQNTNLVEASHLDLNCSLAKKYLQFESQISLDRALFETAKWYLNYELESMNPIELARRDTLAFLKGGGLS